MHVNRSIYVIPVAWSFVDLLIAATAGKLKNVSLDDKITNENKQLLADT